MSATCWPKAKSQPELALGTWDWGSRASGKFSESGVVLPTNLSGWCHEAEKNTSSLPALGGSWYNRRPGSQTHTRWRTSPSPWWLEGHDLNTSPTSRELSHALAANSTTHVWLRVSAFAKILFLTLHMQSRPLSLLLPPPKCGCSLCASISSSQSKAQKAKVTRGSQEQPLGLQNRERKWQRSWAMQKEMTKRCDKEGVKGYGALAKWGVWLEQWN